MAELLATYAAPVRFLHILIAILLVAGLFGRWVALAYAERAARASQLQGLQALLDAGSVFERLTIVMSMVVVVFGLLTAWSVGFPLLGFLQGARSNWLLASLLIYASTMLLVPLVFIPKGKVFDAALSSSMAAGHSTRALTDAFGDPTVRLAHIYEAIAVAAVLALMILKPF
jgi:hypothetical protein